MEPPAEPDYRPLVDASVPSGPRIRDYYLGGKDNFAADRDLAEKLQAEAEGYASVRDLVRASRSFTLRAVQWSASMLSIGQYLNVGCGLPSRPAVHDAARDGYPDARVVYVDSDAMVVSHAAALMAGPGLGALQADPADVAAVLGDPEVTGLLDFTQPACIVLGGVLSAMDAETARTAVAGYAGALAPGSAVIIACISYADRELAARMEALSGPAGGWRNHGIEDVTSFFAAAGLRPVRGKVASVACWPMLPEETPGAAVTGGVGIKD